MDKIKFYGVEDLSFFYYLNKSEEKLKNIDMSRDDYDVNDIMEFYNIIRYSKIKNCNFEKLYKNEVSYIYKQINKFVVKINSTTFYFHFKKLRSEYFDDFWLLLNDYIERLNLPNSFIKRVFNYKKFHVQYFLRCKSLVNKYKSELKKYLLKNKRTAELLLNEYEIENNKKFKLYFPNFTGKEIENIFLNYISNETANLNYLQIIPYLGCDEIKLSDNIKLKALKKTKEKSSALFRNGGGIQFGSEVKIGEFNEPIKVSEKDNVYSYNYDKNWIKENLDFPTLLNNFIYLFEFVDKQMRFVNVSKKSQMGIFESILGVHTKKEYKTGMSFQMIQATALMQMLSYNKELENYDLSIEKCIDWFYSEYLKDEFDINDFIVHIESSPQNHFEKCRVLFPEIDGIIKQFAIYQEYGEIDHDLIEISSNSVLFEQVKSLNKNKYIYADKEKLNIVFYYLFSDQSGLGYLKGSEKYRTLFDLLINEKIKFKDFEDYQREDIKWLLDNKLLKRDRKGFLNFFNNKEIYIYYDLYNNDVISFYHYPLEYQKLMLSLAKKRKLYFKDTLFSEPEIQYMNYYLNNRNVSNGLSIRNRYGHGTQPKKDNEDTHSQNYMYLLYIIVLITIKINDDLCIYDENNKE